MAALNVCLTGFSRHIMQLQGRHTETVRRLLRTTFLPTCCQVHAFRTELTSHTRWRASRPSLNPSLSDGTLSTPNSNFLIKAAINNRSIVTFYTTAHNVFDVLEHGLAF